ncbi:hypothetical protein BKA82DRAFT_120872 [Pisolithus tinctorius]|uniref:CENP-V/GFA domain-containing protein n=1 Tax=Pisolithus tinctorius Marx 270 TaxID=870435 RepID=A0A0C3PXE6_PISTI|nr:hypothetical protein BKA82DRAFT_120872 [Pisolithus tinctorius]KIO14111.1 hypothetical protein M404DRAFT_120872 [Pisolithus tinctorius Marx 270]
MRHPGLGVILTTTKLLARCPGSYFRGQMMFEAITPVALSAHCYCTQCRKLAVCPLVHTMLFADTDFQWTTTG